MNAPLHRHALDLPQPMQPRTRRISPLLWFMAALVSLLPFYLDWLTFRSGNVGNGAYWGRDFVNLWTGGALVREGGWASIYDLPAYQAFQHRLFGPLGPHNYSYPPLSFPIAALFSLLPYPIALGAWVAGTGALFVAACRTWWPEGAGPALLAILTPAAIINVWAGHYGFLLGALFLLAFQQLDRAPIRAGLLFACMLLKPHLAVLVPVVLIARGRWRAIGAGTATVAALVAVTSLLFGWQAWSDFLLKVGPTQAGMIDAGRAFFGLMSSSTMTAMLRLTGQSALAFALHCAVAGIALALVWRAARHPDIATRDLALLTATATFLVLPYAFNYDLTAVALGAVVALGRSRNPTDSLLAGCALLAPSAGMLFAYWGIPFTPLALAGLLFVQWSQIGVQRPYSEPRLSAA